MQQGDYCTAYWIVLYKKLNMPCFLTQFHLFLLFFYFSMSRAMFLLPQVAILTGKKNLQKHIIINVSPFPQTIHFIFYIHLEQQACPR